jgi:hypothetical protein
VPEGGNDRKVAPNSTLSAGATLGARAAYGVLLVPLADALGGGRSLAAGVISF